MSATEQFDAVVIGSGPNGLAAAIALAQDGARVHVIEGAATVGGGMRTRELTLPGFHHDVCSAIHPMALASPFLKSLALDEHGLQFRFAEAAVAHPLDDAPAVALYRSVDRTAEALGEDATRYRRRFSRWTAQADALYAELLGPMRLPRHPLVMAGFGPSALRSAVGFARTFRTRRAQALFAGNAAHAIQPLDHPMTAAIGMMLMISGHAVDWPVAVGGSQSIAAAMVAKLESLGGSVECGRPIDRFDALPRASVYLFDTSPRAMARICSERLPAGYRRRLDAYRHGPGVFKIDWALSEPIPWRDEACRRASTVHVGGTLEELAASERECWEGEHSERPYVLVAQQSSVDASRAPNGQHTGWAYIHVPSGSTRDCTSIVEAQIERFAPGFGDCILARHTMDCADFERYNPNYVGGDIICGVQDWRQLYTRPVARLSPYTTPDPQIYICSSATPPGGGVHGMCGYWAARAARRRLR